jgi:hypothetical protein
LVISRTVGKKSLERTGSLQTAPADDERHADAALIERALAGTEGRVVSDLRTIPLPDVAAVVGAEDDDGAAGDAELIDVVEDAADVFVEVGDHGRIGCIWETLHKSRPCTLLG